MISGEGNGKVGHVVKKEKCISGEGNGKDKEVSSHIIRKITIY